MAIDRFPKFKRYIIEEEKIKRQREQNKQRARKRKMKQNIEYAMIHGNLPRVKPEENYD